MPGIRVFFEDDYYHRHANAFTSQTFSIDGKIVAGIDAQEQYVFLTPSFTFSDPGIARSTGHRRYLRALLGEHVRLGSADRARRRHRISRPERQDEVAVAVALGG